MGLFDDRLINRYTVEDLEKSHPTLHNALLVWFKAFGDFDDGGLAKLVNAKSPADVERAKPRAQAAIDSIPGVVKTLHAVTAELEAALSTTAVFPERAQLEGLLESARHNRTSLVDRLPAMAASSLGSPESYETARGQAAAAVARTAQRLEEMRARSEDTTKSYRDVQPMVAELKGVWRELDQALSALSRQDQRAVRAQEDGRMRAAAMALCRNLFARKMRDRASGAWPAATIAPPGDSAPERFAAALAAANFAEAHATLAPWLARVWTADRLAEEIGRSARAIAESADLAETPPPGAYEVSANPMQYDDMRQEPASRAGVPADVTAGNYRGWFSVNIHTDEEDGYLTDIDTLATVYVLVVSTSDGERIGYLRLAE